MCFEGKMQVTADRVFNVLFLCTHNSARSVIAECVMNRLGKGRFKGYSAGSAPSGGVRPTALDLLKSLEYEISELRSKAWGGATSPFPVHRRWISSLRSVTAPPTKPARCGRGTLPAPTRVFRIPRRRKVLKLRSVLPSPKCTACYPYPSAPSSICPSLHWITYRSRSGSRRSAR
jgi:Low molecular weight phosphotyrosine protein phosphatase